MRNRVRYDCHSSLHKIQRQSQGSHPQFFSHILCVQLCNVTLEVILIIIVLFKFCRNFSFNLSRLSKSLIAQLNHLGNLASCSVVVQNKSFHLLVFDYLLHNSDHLVMSFGATGSTPVLVVRVIYHSLRTLLIHYVCQLPLSTTARLLLFS